MERKDLPWLVSYPIYAMLLVLTFGKINWFKNQQNSKNVRKPEYVSNHISAPVSSSATLSEGCENYTGPERRSRNRNSNSNPFLFDDRIWHDCQYCGRRYDTYGGWLGSFQSTRLEAERGERKQCPQCHHKEQAKFFNKSVMNEVLEINNMEWV